MVVADVSELYSCLGGGIRVYTDNKLRVAAELGHDVDVVAPGPEDRLEEREGGRVWWVRGPHSPWDSRYFVLNRRSAVHELLGRISPDVVESSSASGASRHVSCWHGTAARVLVFHSDPVAQYAAPVLSGVLSAERVDQLCWPVWEDLRRLSRGFSATVVASDWMARRLAEHGLHRPVAVQFGIDRAAFSPTLRDDGLRRELLGSCGKDEHARLVVAVSRLSVDKRIPMLISAFELAARGLDLALVIYGDGPLRPQLERQARRSGNIRLAGFESDHARLARVLASADALLHGGAGETYGLAVAESLCSGTPVIVPDCGGAPELTRPGCCEQYAAGDPRDCAAAIGRLLNRDQAALRACCEEAARSVPDWREHFRRLFGFYAELSAERGQHRVA
jgi:alpha-1,6-mannosyltransferase